MDLTTLIRELRAERERIDQALLALGQLAKARKARGRPPKWLSAAMNAADRSIAPSSKQSASNGSDSPRVE